MSEDTEVQDKIAIQTIATLVELMASISYLQKSLALLLLEDKTDSRKNLGLSLEKIDEAQGKMEKLIKTTEQYHGLNNG